MVLAELSNYWWLIIILWGLGFLANNWQKSREILSQTPWWKYNLNFPYWKKFPVIKSGLIFAGISLLMFAVWRPQWGEGLQKTERKGLDVVFTVDVSKSMKALDFSQGRQLISRLDAAKYLVREFIKNRPQDRIGLIEFAGESFVASPLTLDHNVFTTFLENISSDDLGKQGTNLAEALSVSLARLDVQSSTERGKAVLLFSDGDETINSEVTKIAEIARDKGVKIYTIGIGSEEGSPIPDGQDAFGRIIYKKYHGQTVLAKLNPDPLQKIAEITGGKYFHAEKVSDLKELEKKLAQLPQKILKQESLAPQAEQYMWFTGAGLILLLLGFFCPKSREIFNLWKQ